MNIYIYNPKQKNIIMSTVLLMYSKSFFISLESREANIFPSLKVAFIKTSFFFLKRLRVVFIEH